MNCTLQGPIENMLFYFAYDSLDPTGNITIKWDVIQWTSDGYVAVVSIFNFQQYRHIQAPGWTLGWTWAKKEVIWSMVGAQATEQGDCSKYKAAIPHCCKKDPTVVDLLPGTPYNMQIANCCRGGVINSWAQDPVTAVSSFQLSVGAAGTSNKTVRVPKNFTLQAPGPGYTCGAASTVKPTRFLSQDGRRQTQALIGVRLRGNSPYLASAISNVAKNSFAPLVQCTNHMCPIRVHWHVKLNYQEYWRVKITVTNFNYRMNYSMWNLVVQHPNFDNLTQIFSFYYKSLNPYQGINDTAMLWGIKFYNDLLMQAGPSGNVQSELLFRKEPDAFTFEKGWAFPRRIYFNGDNCVMPPPDSYPWLPNASPPRTIAVLLPITVFMAYLAFFLS
ncbi:COBRA-like protein 1 [Asimina triloba]